MVEVSTVRGELRVSLSYDDFIKILRMMISGIEVNEGWYLKAHEDIARAISNGAVASARQHFVDDDAGLRDTQRRLVQLVDYKPQSSESKPIGN